MTAEVYPAESADASSGALLTEIVFSYPGVGYLLFTAIGSDDYPLLQGIFLIITLAVLLANLAAPTAEPGGNAEVRLAVPARAFARYDETARAWVWPPGEFAIRIGRSSGDLRLLVRVNSLFCRTVRPGTWPGSGLAAAGPGPADLAAPYNSRVRMRVATICGVATAIVVCAGCTGGSARPQASHSPASPAAPAAPAALPGRGLPSPGCSTATAVAPRLGGVRTAMVPMPSPPFGVVVAPDGRWAFAAVITSVQVLRLGPSLAPVKVRAIAMPPTFVGAGETLTSDGRYLLAASGRGAVVISVARAEQGSPGAVLGTLVDPTGGSGAIEVAVSPEGGYAFVTMEDSGRAAVFDLHRALTQGFGPADFVGSIPLGNLPVGLAVSPGGRWLYATSEVRAGAGRNQQGTLTVINLPRAETDPAASVVATVAAGCNPVRVVTSADGREVWVTARASDDLLCFSAAALRASPAHALVAVIRVGEAPVGLMLVRGGSLVAVADSNRFGAPGASSDLSVVDVAAALAGRPAVIGNIPAGRFPREMALVPGGQRLLVSNYLSEQLEAISVPSIP